MKGIIGGHIRIGTIEILGSIWHMLTKRWARRAVQVFTVRLSILQGHLTKHL
jgi:hypothetical protein